jgi:hypothetical protein
VPDHCGNDTYPQAYDPEERAVVVGRGWVLVANGLSGVSEVEPIAEALGARAQDLCA